MTEPTDDELLALIEKHLGLKPRRDDTVIDPRTGRFHDVQRYRDLKADILAKWGTPPAVAGEPIGYLYCGGSYGDELADWEIVADQHQCDKLNEHHGSLGKEAKLPIYTTQQPTQAQAGAVPLTDEQLAEIMRETWGCASIAPRHAIGFARAIERAHGIGIKGGQHGAE